MEKPEGFGELLIEIEKLFDIRCAQYKEDYLKRRISSRMNATRIPSCREYQKYMLANKAEQELLKNALTINVTKFFRDPEVFELVKREIFPLIIKDRRRIRIWSAGCSSGEEPYTYAIMLYELSLTNPSLDYLIYATDIDQVILKRAKEGIYEKSALENVSELQIVRHFNARPDGKFEVKPHLREHIRFQHHDLMKGVPISRFLNLISCRNVTIYFTESQKNDLARMFYDGLVPGGFYVIGMSEYLGREIEHLFKPYKALQKIFIKSDPKNGAK